MVAKHFELLDLAARNADNRQLVRLPCFDDICECRQQLARRQIAGYPEYD